MSANDHLHEPQFHGARRRIDDTHVRPASMTGAHAASSHGFGADHHQHAFATPSERIAWSYAAVGQPHPDNPVNSDPDPKHRAHVYAVAPAADQQHDGGEIMSRTGFRITADHDQRPGQTGTFPQVNWNAYKRRTPGRMVSSLDYNHHAPEEEDRARAAEAHSKKVVAEREAAQPHPQQMSLFSGKTVAEHAAFEKMPGYGLQHLSRRQFDVESLRKDPVSLAYRRKQNYHHTDVEFGTVV